MVHYPSTGVRPFRYEEKVGRRGRYHFFFPLAAASAAFLALAVCSKGDPLAPWINHGEGHSNAAEGSWARNDAYLLLASVA